MYIAARTEGDEEFILLICFGDKRNWKESTRDKVWLLRSEEDRCGDRRSCHIRMHRWIFLYKFRHYNLLVDVISTRDLSRDSCVFVERKTV